MKEYRDIEEKVKTSLPANAISWKSTELQMQKKVLIVNYAVAVFKSRAVYINQLHKPLIKDV